MTLIKRLDIGRPITAEEMDANLQYLEDSINVGTSGTSGTSGTRGTSGTNGSGGTSGTSGISGEAGSSGTSGISGETGSNGTSGISGEAGTSGSSGTSGISGEAGSSGTSGISGEAGSSGTSGISGEAGSSGTSGTSISLTMSDGTTTVTGVRNITLSNLGLSPSGSGGATITNFGGGGGETTINVSSGSATISSVSTLRFNSPLTINDNGGGTVGISVDIVSGGGGGTSGTSGTAGSSILLTVFDGTDIPFNNVNTLKFTTDFTVNSSGSGVVVISSVSGSGDGGIIVSGSGFPFSGSAVITGSLEVIGNVTASAFAITSIGVPTIESSTNINLTAGGVVNITQSPLRLANFTNSETGSITAQNGDMIYNSTTNKFMGYASGSWVQLH